MQTVDVSTGPVCCWTKIIAIKYQIVKYHKFKSYGLLILLKFGGGSHIYNLCDSCLADIWVYMTSVLNFGAMKHWRKNSREEKHKNGFIKGQRFKQGREKGQSIKAFGQSLKAIWSQICNLLSDNRPYSRSIRADLLPEQGQLPQGGPPGDGPLQGHLVQGIGGRTAGAGGRWTVWTIDNLYLDV